MKDIQSLIQRLENCDICPHNCNIDRSAGETGTCGMDNALRIASFGPHYGEEPELVGYTSSGTIFLSGCNLLCEFCQNYSISHYKEGRSMDEVQLADIMIQLQEYGCANINLVTPTHFSPQLIKSILIARDKGLKLPVVYNSGGYDKVETLRYWEGIVDIYMPDLKFVDPAKCKKYSSAPNYWDIASAAVLEMHRQTGNLIVENEIGQKGLLIRHLILPNNQSDSKDIIDFVAEKISTDTYINLMDQYRPCYKSDKFHEIDRRIESSEFREIVDYAHDLGFYRPDYLF